MREWFESASLSVAAFEQIDVDQLGGHEDWARPDLFAWSIELFEELSAEICGALNNASSTLLVIPLEYSAQLDTLEPDVNGLLSTEWSQLEVPGLYVFQSERILGWDAKEEYRRELTSHLLAKVSMAYYRCWRTGPSEFARALYFVRHPETASP